MTAFTQDKIFKNVNDEDARILLDIMGIKSKKSTYLDKGIEIIGSKRLQTGHNS